MNKFKLDDNTEYLAEDLIDGYLINPVFHDGLGLELPFIIRMEHQFSVHHLINGCLRCWGVFYTLDNALKCAKSGPSWGNKACA
jgi:hypothetical protein